MNYTLPVPSTYLTAEWVDTSSGNSKEVLGYLAYSSSTKGPAGRLFTAVAVFYTTKGDCDHGPGSRVPTRGPGPFTGSLDGVPRQVGSHGS